MSLKSKDPSKQDLIPPPVDPRWKSLYTTGGVAALIMLALMIAQIIVFVIWPPPSTPEGFFDLFDRSWLLGLLSLDLFYIIDSILLIFIYLALYFVLRKAGETPMLIAVILGIVGVGAYFASNTAFEMLSLSHQYAAASTEAQRIMYLTAGQVMLETYTGTSFDIYYVLNTAVLFLIAPVMFRSRYFSKAAASLALLSGILMIIPSSAGILGLYFSLASLVPWAVWLILIAGRLLRFGRET